MPLNPIRSPRHDSHVAEERGTMVATSYGLGPPSRSWRHSHCCRLKQRMAGRSNLQESQDRDGDRHSPKLLLPFWSTANARERQRPGVYKRGAADMAAKRWMSASTFAGVPTSSQRSRRADGESNKGRTQMLQSYEE